MATVQRLRGRATIRRTGARLATVVFCAVWLGMAAQGTRADDVDLALQKDAADRSAALARLRDQGPVGLDQLLRRAEKLEQQFGKSPDNKRLSETLITLSEAINEVGGAKYCRQSGLYWYTDMQRAQAAARASGKPILALRMLGRLTDELSCANSRFFRTTLYANAEIAQYLRENFVLTWTSVRPVPKITIDFGDGRKIERTITGNSIHFVLTTDGQVVDALPGLYGPAEFLAQVRRAHDAAAKLSQLSPPERTELRARYHHAALARIAERWQADLRAIDPANHANFPRSTNAVNARSVLAVMAMTKLAAGTGGASAAAPTKAAPTKAAPTKAAPTKAAPTKAASVDLRDGGETLPSFAALQELFTTLDERTTEATWDKVAALHATDAELDDASKNLIEAQRPHAAIAARLAMTKRVVESPMLRLFANLRQSTALDTVKNEYTFHRKLHAWLLESPDQVNDLSRLNERVYAELFLTPSADPWLGLGQPDVYAAIPNNGVVEKTK